MLLTVVVPTFNRASSLEITLRGLAAMTVPEDLRWEVLVVDNNSTDGTRDVVLGRDWRMPIRYTHEPRQGVAYTRTRGLRESTGRYVAWVDDDILVEPQWLLAYLEAFEAHPDAALFGGPIAPWFEVPPPQWLQEVLPTLLGAYGGIEFEREIEFSLETLPHGGNFVTRRDAMLEREFDARLGVRGQERLNGEESAMMAALIESGERGWSVPDARVRHFVPTDKMSIQYLRRYHIACGRTAVLRGGPGAGPQWLGRPRWVWRAAVEGELRHRVVHLLRGRAASIPHLIDACHAWGRLGVRVRR